MLRSASVPDVKEMVIHEISSRSNPWFKKLVRLLGGRSIKKQGLSFLSGQKQVIEVLREFPDRCYAILFTRRHSLSGVPAGIKSFLLSGELFREIDVYGTKAPILLIRFEPLSEWDSREWPAGCTLFVPFQDPGNVGAVIRSAAAFGVSRLVILEEGAHPFHHRSLKVAGSAVFRIPLFGGPSIKALGSERYPIITLSAEGAEIGTYTFPSTFGLVPGLEGPGLPCNLRHLTSLSIPMKRGVESLNAALATGIALYVWRNRMEKE
jgi:tRNA G18 (ribose-2'-O)-methylase SpoU